MIGAPMVKIRFRYVVEDRDQRGNVRLYLRLPGRAKVRLREMPGTEAFLAEYQAAVAGFAPRPAVARRVVAETGSLLWLCNAYAATGEFRRLDTRTQRVRRRILEICCAEPVGPGKAALMGALPARRMPPKVITALRDRKADLPESANARVKAFRQVFAWAVGAGHADLNPAREVAYLAPDAGGFTAWTHADIERFEAAHPVGTKARLALALLLFTGQRRSDVVRLGPQHVRDGWLTFTQAKNARRAPVTLSIPMHPELARIIAATPGSGALAFLVTDFGRPFTANGFGNRFRKWCETAGLPDLAAHGLRKAAAARLAEAGATDREIMAITGHRTAKEVTRYTASADQRKRAQRGMAKWASVPVEPTVTIQWDDKEKKSCPIKGSDKTMVPRGGIVVLQGKQGFPHRFCITVRYHGKPVACGQKPPSNRVRMRCGNDRRTCKSTYPERQRSIIVLCARQHFWAQSLSIKSVQCPRCSRCISAKFTFTWTIFRS